MSNKVEHDDFFITCANCGHRIRVEGRVYGIPISIICPQCDHFHSNPTA